MPATHEVFNQTPLLRDYNLFTSDEALATHLEPHDVGWADSLLVEFGAEVGTGEVIDWGFEANRNEPALQTHDPLGRRIDEISFHPAYHHLMALSMRYGLHSLPWEGREGGYVARAVLFSLMAQIEAGHGCPISMTTSVIPSLRHSPHLATEWEQRITRSYDPRPLPAQAKDGVTLGMALTEKQGGSDVRSNTSTAQPNGDDGYRLTGHKWFCSAPMSDAFLVLAQAGAGLTCFLMPRWTPDGARNGIHVQRLKDKLGNRSNASAEIEFEDAWAVPVGDEGNGVRVIVEMINHTRLDCVLGSTGLMRQALVQAVHHARHRSAFGNPLYRQPLMQAVLADLALESEAATAAMLRLSAAFDRSSESESEALLARLATPVAKYWITKRTPGFIYECLECLGGNGYVEESMMPRLFRESPVNAVWEGSGNVIALDVLRALERAPSSRDAFLDELEPVFGSNKRFDRGLQRLKSLLATPIDPGRARTLVELMARLLQASLLIRQAPGFVADAFVATRLEGTGHLYGSLPESVTAEPLVDRAFR